MKIFSNEGISSLARGLHGLRRSSVRLHMLHQFFNQPGKYMRFPGFFVSVQPPCLRELGQNCHLKAPFGRFPSGGLFAFQTPFSAILSNLWSKIHTLAEVSGRHVDFLAPLVLLHQSQGETHSLLKRVVIKRSFL